jgi:hypothetical protein
MDHSRRLTLNSAKASKQQLSAKPKKKPCLDVENPRLIDVVDNVDLDEQGKVKYHYVIIDYLVHVKAATSKLQVTLRNCVGCHLMK